MDDDEMLARLSDFEREIAIDMLGCVFGWDEE